MRNLFIKYISEYRRKTENPLWTSHFPSVQYRYSFRGKQNITDKTKWEQASACGLLKSRRASTASSQ